MELSAPNPGPPGSEHVHRKGLALRSLKSVFCFHPKGEESAHLTSPKEALWGSSWHGDAIHAKALCCFLAAIICFR